MFPAWEHTRGGLEGGKNLGQLKNQKMASMFLWMFINVHICTLTYTHTSVCIKHTSTGYKVHTCSEAHVPVWTTTPTHAPVQTHRQYTGAHGALVKTSTQEQGVQRGHRTRTGTHTHTHTRTHTRAHSFS